MLIMSQLKQRSFMIKNYKKWMGVKAKINNDGKFRKINEGVVVWAAVGGDLVCEF